MSRGPQAFPRGGLRANLRGMRLPLATRHPEAFADERQAPWVAALWAAMLLLAVAAALLSA